MWIGSDCGVESEQREGAGRYLERVILEACDCGSRRTDKDAPGGNKTIQIENGSQIVSCPAASTQETFVSGSCTDPSKHFYAPNNISGTCSVITYTAFHSEYEPVVETPQPCEAAIISTRLTTCTRDHDGASVDLANCPTDSDAVITSTSPQGNKTVTFSNGSRNVTCEANSMVQTFVSGSCTNSSDEYLPIALEIALGKQLITLSVQ